MLCTACILDLQRKIDELPHLATALRLFLGGSMKVTYQSKVKSTKEPSPPMNVTVFDLLEDIEDAYTYVEDRAADDLVRQPPRLYDVWVDGNQQKQYLTGVDRAIRVLRIHKKCSDEIGLAPVSERRLAPCPECGEPSLQQWSGSEIISCIECGYDMTDKEYQDYCLFLDKISGLLPILGQHETEESQHMSGETTLTIVGNLTAAPELRFTQGGAAVANFTVASTPRTFDKNTNEWKDGDPLFMRCSIWREAAENITESLDKGARVIVTGRLKQRSYEDPKTKDKRTVVELEVEEIGPSLKYATARVSKVTKGEARSKPASDPWAASGEEPPPF
jgi:single-strand DNA-binding protein